MSKRYRGNDLTLGYTASGEPITWTAEMRRLHMYVSGVTGSGKSRFLLSMLRQDLDQHARSRQGLLLIDPHGELYDGALSYIADNPALWRLPVILIDLRKDDWIVAYNLLKERPGIDPAVVATSFVESITHAFGGGDPTETPRLARVARIFIQALFDGKRTLLDLLPMLSHENAAQREALVRDLPPSQARILLEQFNQLGKRDFDAWVESFLNRLSPMLTNRVIGTMVGQTDPLSFDFDKAIEQGAIVLVSLATERGKIARSDSRLFASLLLSDLLQVAMLRGKKGDGLVKPFAVYADEFQTYLTPTMSANLDESRGFGLQFILAQQYPGQTVLQGGEHGKAIASSVMVNARTKVAFQAAEQPEERAALVAALFDGAIDVHRVEERLVSPQVVGYREIRRALTGRSTARGITETTGTSITTARSDGKTVSRGSVAGEGEGRTESSSSGRTRGMGHVDSYGMSDSMGSGTTTPDALGLDVPLPSSAFTSTGTGSSHAGADIESESESESESTATSVNSFRATNEAEAHQAVETKATGSTHTTGRSDTFTDSWREQVTLEPILAERPTQLMSVENQVYEFGQRLAAQARQHAHVRLPGNRLPDAFRAVDCPDMPISERFVDRIRMRLLARTNCALMFADAVARLAPIAPLPLPDPDQAIREAVSGRRRARVVAPKENGDE